MCHTLEALRDVGNTSLEAAWDKETRDRPATRIRTIPWPRPRRLYCSDDGKVDTTVSIRQDGCEEYWCSICHKKLMVVEQ